MTAGVCLSLARDSVSALGGLHGGALGRAWALEETLRWGHLVSNEQLDRPGGAGLQPLVDSADGHRGRSFWAHQRQEG